MLRNPRILLYIGLLLALLNLAHIMDRAQALPLVSAQSAPNIDLKHRKCVRGEPYPQVPKNVPNATYVAVNSQGQDVTIPKRYRKGARGVTVDFLSDKEVDRICAGGVAVCDMVYYACDDGRHIVAPNPCNHLDESFAETLCHELAHVNGWPAWHGN